MKLVDLFDTYNGIVSSELEVLPSPKDGNYVPYLRPASTQQRTLSGWVDKRTVPTSKVFLPESLFVSTNGEGSHSFAYVSRFAFIPNSDITVLVPKRKMTLNEKLFFARCITMNRWRFSFGRKPKGLRFENIELPDEIPSYVETLSIENTRASLRLKVSGQPAVAIKPTSISPLLNTNLTTIDKLFYIEYGTDMELVKLKRDEYGVNFVSRTAKNNGISAKVKRVTGIDPIGAGVLTVAGGGSVLETFYQTEPFYSGRDLFYLKPKEKMTDEEMLFYCTAIRANQFRYSYGRQANKTLKSLLVPARASIPAWIYGLKGRTESRTRELI